MIEIPIAKPYALVEEIQPDNPRASGAFISPDHRMLQVLECGSYNEPPSEFIPDGVEIVRDSQLAIRLMAHDAQVRSGLPDLGFLGHMPDASPAKIPQLDEIEARDKDEIRREMHLRITLAETLKLRALLQSN